MSGTRFIDAGLLPPLRVETWRTGVGGIDRKRGQDRKERKRLLEVII